LPDVAARTSPTGERRKTCGEKRTNEKPKIISPLSL
jgi:hypothetical protein